MKLYSISTGGFYDPAIHAKIPADAVKISEAAHAALLAGQAKGKAISADDNGVPVLAERPAPSASALAAAARRQRDRLLAASDWTQLPDSPVDQKAWAKHRQSLRDITKQSGFPDKIDWPRGPKK